LVSRDFDLALLLFDALVLGVVSQGSLAPVPHTVGLLQVVGLGGVVPLLVLLEDDADEFIFLESFTGGIFLLLVDEALITILNHVLILLVVERAHYLRPLLALLQHLPQQYLILLWLPLALHFAGVELVQPSLPALLSAAEVLLVALGEELLGNAAPLYAARVLLSGLLRMY
jgi:hypothetical protein